MAAATLLALSSFAASIETDRTWYLAGEAMKVSVTDDDAIIAYAELCDMRGLVAGVVVGLKDGVGSKVVELPSDLHSGYYLLSAYTRDNTQVTQRLVAVVNPLRRSADDDMEWVKIEDPDSLSYPESAGLDNTTRSKRECSMSNAHWSTFNVRETEGHIIMARVKNVNNGKTFDASQIFPSMSIVGKQVHYFEGQMVNDSTAVFYTFGIHGKRPLVLSARAASGESMPIEVISPFSAILPKQLPHLVFHYQRSEVEARSLDMQRHQIAITPAKREAKLGDFSDDTAEDGVPLEYDETVHGTKPDMSYNLDEYRQFLTIREALLEYVMFVRNTRINGVPQLTVRTGEDYNNNLLPSLVLIDGMPVYNTERLLNYDARRVHYINIYGGQYTFGNGVFNGLLSFVTRSGRLTNYPIEHNMQYLVYEFPE